MIDSISSGQQPHTTADIADAVRAAAARRVPLRIVGRGHWLDAGRPVRAAEKLVVGALTGIVEYTAGDLTLTARAGTALAELRAATAREGQWLPLDPGGSDDGSLGATVATASAGSLSGAFGSPRDVVLGVEFVTGAGQIARGGGRVVKNVAGFDLTRLVTGAWGTLGILTEITVRLRARPEHDLTLAVVLGASTSGLGAVAARLRAAPLAPIALEAVNAALAAYLGVGDRTVVLVRLAGNEDAVRAQRDTLAAMAELSPAPHGVWERLRTCETARPGAATPPAVLRLSQRPSRIGMTWDHALALAGTGGFVHASLARGVARCILETTDRTGVRKALGSLPADVTRMGERLPAGLWPADGMDDRLSRGVRAAFDPLRILNPGILGDAS